MLSNLFQKQRANPNLNSPKTSEKQPERKHDSLPFYAPFGNKDTGQIGLSQKQQNIPLGLAHFYGPKTSHGISSNGVSLTKAGFMNNAVGFRSIKFITESAAFIPLGLMAQNVQITSIKLDNLLKKPNKSQSQTEFLEEVYLDYIIYGECFLQAELNAENEIVKLIRLRPDRMEINFDDKGEVTSYIHKKGKRQQIFKLQNDLSLIFHFKAPNPLNDERGLSPLQAAKSAIALYEASNQWSESLMSNAARPSGALVYKGPDGHDSLSESQYKRLVDEIEMNHQGARNAGRPMLLEGGLDWKPMAFSPADMQSENLRQGAAREIALALGVPPMLLGIPGDNTYSNYQEAGRAFYRQTIMPLVSRFANGLTKWLGDWEMLDIDEYIQPNFDNISALSAERDAYWQRIISADFLSDDEKRAMLGLQKRDNSDQQSEK